jgi:hypothetical protein
MSLRPPVIIDSIGLYGGGAPKIFSAIGVLNIDPRLDPWQIQVSQTMIYPDANTHGRAASQIRDIKLHLGLSALLDKKIASWSTLNWWSNYRSHLLTLTDDPSKHNAGLAGKMGERSMSIKYAIKNNIPVRPSCLFGAYLQDCANTVRCSKLAAWAQ